jgi:hypothetical protein
VAKKEEAMQNLRNGLVAALGSDIKYAEGNG